MKEKKVVIVTTTFYKDIGELRFALACILVKEAVEAGHKIVIVDASPNPAIATQLSYCGAHVFPQLHKGMGAGRRQAFFQASEIANQCGIKYILWTEPEKEDLIRSVEKIVSPIRVNDVQIVVPRRSEQSWESWPEFQVASEKKANAVYNEAFGTNDIDPMFGPVAFSIDVADYFIRCYTERFGTDKEGKLNVADTYIQHFAPQVAKKAGVGVKSVEIDMVYPPRQKAEEEQTTNNEIQAKRKWQLESLSASYRTVAEYLQL